MKIKFFKILILFTLLCSAANSLSHSTAHGRKTSIRVLGPSYNSYEAELVLQIDGEIVCDGGCTPQPLLGLIRKNEMNGWDTLVDIKKLGQLLCGPGKHTWRNDTIQRQVFLDVPYIGITKELKNTSGIFKLTFLKYKNGGSKIGCSNEFYIKIQSPEKKNRQALTGYVDTTIIGGLSSYPLYHYRVFYTNTFDNQIYIWHRIRYDGEGGNGEKYLFDKVFYYAVASIDKANNYFISIQDFNHDGYTDFRTKTHPGQLDNLRSQETTPGYSAYEYYLYDNAKRTFILSETLSEAYHISIDSTANKLTAHYYREVPLERGYLYEANYELPSMKAISSYKLERTGDGGTNKIPVDVHEWFPSVKLSSTELQQPPMYIVRYDIPEITTNKKHYFAPDTVYLLLNTAGDLKDISKVTVILEEKYTEDGKWHFVPNPYLEEKQKLKTDYGYKIKAGDVTYIENLEFGWLGLLTVGTYRIRVLLNEKEVAKTEEFYVHD